MNANLVFSSLIIGILALAAAVLVWGQNRSLAKLKKTFFAGKQAGDLEDIILELRQRLDIANQQLAQLERALKQLQYDTGFAIQKTGLVRFNPFKDGGGNFSFCLALLDQHDNGVVLTSMYGREQNRIYTKNIRDGHSDNPLNEEEQKAINLANQK